MMTTETTLTDRYGAGVDGAGVRADRRADLTGLDDGPYLPGHGPRKKPAAKTAEELASIRRRAWATRRAAPPTPEAPMSETLAIAELLATLKDARDNGLIYWEPNTERGHVAKALMLARIDAALAKATTPGGSDE